MGKIDIKELSEIEQKELRKQLDTADKNAKTKQKEDRIAFKELSHEFVNKNINALVKHKEFTEGLIENLFKDYKAILDLKTIAYGEKDLDSHTSTLEDGSASIRIGHNVTISFNGTESSGVEKIKNFINSLANEDENTKKLTSMVNTFLKPNSKTRMLNPAKIIELSKLRDEFDDEEFNDGLDIIFNAQIRNQNSMYVSGWKTILVEDIPKKLEFRFTV